MKNIALVASLIFGGNVVAFSQCDKKIILTSSFTEYLDSNNVVERSVPENTTITIDKSTLIIAPGSNTEMKGSITENTCKWKVPYKDGRSTLKAKLTDDGGNINNATLNIEGKDGKVTLAVQIAEMPGKIIKVNIDTFEEAK